MMKTVVLLFCFCTLFATLGPAQTAEGPGREALAPPVTDQAAADFPAIGYITPTGSASYQPLLAARSRLVAAADPMAEAFDLSQFLVLDDLSQAEIYRGIAAAIDMRLQLGALPMAPVLVNQWNEAQAAIDRMETNQLQLAAQDADWQSLRARLDTVQQELQALGEGEAFENMDAVNYRQLVGDAEVVRGFTDDWLAQLSEHMAAQSGFVTAGRSDLAALKRRIIEGNDVPAANGLTVTDENGQDLPVFVVTFDRPGVVFEDQLNRLLQDLGRLEPDYRLDIVAVAEKHKDPARQELLQNESLQYTQAVIRALERLGLTQERYTLTDAILETRLGSEVRLFLRSQESEEDPQDTVDEAPPAENVPG